jgi:hypothetical protein
LFKIYDEMPLELDNEIATVWCNFITRCTSKYHLIDTKNNGKLHILFYATKFGVVVLLKQINSNIFCRIPCWNLF